MDFAEECQVKMRLKQGFIILKMMFTKLRYRENLFQRKNYWIEINGEQDSLQIILTMQNYFLFKDSGHYASHFIFGRSLKWTME